MPEDQDRCDVPHCTCPPEHPLHIPAGTTGIGAIEAITHMAHQRISEDLIQPPSNGRILDAYMGYTNGQDSGFTAESVLAARWPGMGFDPDSEESAFTPSGAAPRTHPRTHDELRSAGQSWHFGEGVERTTCPLCEASHEHLHSWVSDGYTNVERVPGTDSIARSEAIQALARGTDIPISVFGGLIPGLSLGSAPALPAEPTDTYGYDTPGAAEKCWADDWTRDRFGGAECGMPADPDSILGLCTKHEADKARFNEERGPEPAALGTNQFWVGEPGATWGATLRGPMPTRCECVICRWARSGQEPTDIQTAHDAAERHLAEIGRSMEPVAALFASIFEGVHQAVNSAVEAMAVPFRAFARSMTGMAEEAGKSRGEFMEGAGWADHFLSGHRWRDPETGEQWRVAGRRGDKHWIRTGPRRARWWK